MYESELAEYIRPQPDDFYSHPAPMPVDDDWNQHKGQQQQHENCKYPIDPEGVAICENLLQR